MAQAVWGHDTVDVGGIRVGGAGAHDASIARTGGAARRVQARAWSGAALVGTKQGEKKGKKERRKRKKESGLESGEMGFGLGENSLGKIKLYNLNLYFGDEFELRRCISDLDFK